MLGEMIEEMTFDSPSTPQHSPIVDPRQDFAPSSKATTETTGFKRIFAHSTYGCYGVITSVLVVTHLDPGSRCDYRIRITPFRAGIQSKENSNNDNMVV